MEGSSGLIVAFVVALWAAYFVPLVLRRYDETGKNSSLDLESADRRVVEPRRAGRPVAAQQRADRAPEVSTASPHVDRTSPAVDVPRPRVTRETARIAARRRRNVLLSLVAVLAVLSGLAVAKVLAPWAPAIGAALIVGWLVLCRVMVRSERQISGSGSALRTVGRVLVAVPKAIVRFVGWSLGRVGADDRAGSAADEEHTVIVSDQVEEYDPNQRHVMETDAPLAADALDEQLQIAVPSVAVQTGEPVWDPLPITVPTYVSKPRAGRTVRTIEFGEPGTWTSGHVEGEQTELPATERDGDDGTERHAVGH